MAYSDPSINLRDVLPGSTHDSGHDMNALLDAVQHPYAQLADALHAGADIASAHYEQDTAIPAVAHASNQHVNDFHL